MTLLHIVEPGQRPAATPPACEPKRVIGIDLGTTHSLVATVQAGRAVVLPDPQGRAIMPSVVHYGADDRLVGHAACAFIQHDPANTLVSVKRLLGRRLADLQADTTAGIVQLPYRFADTASSVPYLVTRQGNVSPIDVSAAILKCLAERAEQALGGPLAGAVITVPAYFDDAQRQATKDAAQLAGLPVYRLLNEPTAAAVAYGLDDHHGAQADADQRTIAVYDLGGGTFDISVLRLEQGVLQVLATGGDTALGGDDVDNAIAEWLWQQAGLADQPMDHQQLRTVIMQARQAKQALTTAEAVTVNLNHWSGQLTRSVLHTLIEPLLERTCTLFKRALQDAQITMDALDAVVMVGGSTRIPQVQKRIAALTGREPLTSIDPDTTVAVGAAIQANRLAGNDTGADLLLLDVVPLSLGLETLGGLMETIIHRNTAIPVSKAQEFTTHQDGQTAMVIHVFQGEREQVKDNRSLARFELRGIPPMPAGAAKVRVTFQVDADGLLSVSAQELTTGVSSQVVVKPAYGLSDDDIARMIRASQTHAAEDRDARALREQEIAAEQMIASLLAALAQDGEALLDPNELAALQADVVALKQVRQSGDTRAIAAEIERVNHTSEGFAARRMNHRLQQALVGRTVDDW